MAKKDETFLLVSLEEEKAKKLAQVISNDTCRKILDRLAKGKATETELSKELGIPISTVHYNLKHLVDNKLVDAEEFHYSEKGKEVLHYSLSNKYVIIAPKGVSEKFKDKLKSIIGAILSVGFIGLVFQYLPKLFFLGSAKSSISSGAMERAVSQEAIAPVADAFAGGPVAPAVSDVSQPIAMWIAIGAVLCLILYLLFEYIRKRRAK